MIGTLQFTTSNVSGKVVTLPFYAVAVKSVRTEIVGFHTTAQEAPVTYTVVHGAPASATEVQLSAANTLTFDTTTNLNTTYGVAYVDYVPVGGQPVVGP